MRKIQTLTLLCGVALLAACSSSPKTNLAAPSQPTAATQSASSDANAKPVDESKVVSVVVPPHLDPKNALSTKRSVYFDYDNFAVKPEFQGMLDMHGKYLVKNPNLMIRVEGNTDERGSAEYNLALGQKRDEAVAKVLKLSGVPDSQVEAVSWGKEKPRASGSSEATYAENRRADLVYPR